MYQMVKSGFKISFIKSSCLENIFKTGLPPWFYKKNIFILKIIIFNFTYLRKKLINYQIITEAHKKLSIWIPTSYTSPIVLSMYSQLHRAPIPRFRP